MPTMTVLNIEEFTAKLGYLGTQQVPFATALALSRCGEEAVAASKGGLSGKFIIRNNWLAKGYRVDYAKKDSLVATVRHLDSFMLTQEVGGQKAPRTAKDVAVPVGARSNPTALTPQSKWPGAIARRFYITKGGAVLEFARTGRRTKGKRGTRHVDRRAGPRPLDPNVKLMYVLKPSVHVRPRLGLVAQCTATVRERFGENFVGFLEFAIRTGR